MMMCMKYACERIIVKHLSCIFTISHLRRMSHETVIKSAAHRWSPMAVALLTTHGAGIKLNQWPFRKHIYRSFFFFQIYVPKVKPLCHLLRSVEYKKKKKMWHLLLQIIAHWRRKRFRQVYRPHMIWDAIGKQKLTTLTLTAYNRCNRITLRTNKNY